MSIIVVTLAAALFVAAQDTTLTPAPDTVSAPAADSGSAVIVPGSPETMALQKLLRGSSTKIGVYETVESRRLWKIVRDTYAERRYRLIWWENGGFPVAPQLLDAVRKAAEHGLDPSVYPSSALETRLARAGQGGPEERAAMDLSLSHLFVTYALHLGRGRVDPRDVEALEWYLPKRRVGVGRALASVAETGDVAGVLDDVESHRPEYRQLLDVLHRLDQLAKEGWPRVPTWKWKASPGETRSELALVRNYLRVMGDLPPGTHSRNPAMMDDMLMKGIMRFQGRHGLTSDGVVGPKTAAAFRVPPSELMRRVRLNLERWRWMPDSLDSRYVMVNVPAYELEVVEGEAPVLAMRVIAGTTDTPTPSFREMIRHLELNPMWHVPGSIAAGEILPKVQKDPDYLLAENITVFDTAGKKVDPATIQWTSLDPATLPYRFRQEPGDTNPLGSIKFLFPNRWSVYLHDTPATQLFAKEQRALSHGCVRIERPLDMANYLLQGQTTLTPEELAEQVKSGKRRSMDLKRPVPIYLVYFTTFVDRHGLANFRPDVYGRDQILLQALREYPSPWVPPDTSAVAGPSTN
ncbi:MAG TPA: L,D-transpeptidase family protein [Candidatus Eisenbacteria bacterium]|nr:L,D-transpeptidase family protein [Candidatus Eisenbacteria bacterium]